MVVEHSAVTLTPLYSQTEGRWVSHVTCHGLGGIKIRVQSAQHYEKHNAVIF